MVAWPVTLTDLRQRFVASPQSEQASSSGSRKSSLQAQPPRGTTMIDGPSDELMEVLRAFAR